jgi:hypothetical protein
MAAIETVLRTDSGGSARKTKSSMRFRLLIAVLGLSTIVAVVSFLANGRIALGYAWLQGYAIHVEAPRHQVAVIGEVIEIRAKLTAIGSADVEVVGARLPCGCLEIKPMPVRIARGASEELVILFDTSDRKPMEFKVGIELFLGVSSPQVTIPLHVTLVD